MKKALLWVWMLTKRLYKKPTFLAILLLIPVLVGCYSLAAREDSGIVSVALATEDGSKTAAAFLEQLESGSQLLRLVRCEPEEARVLVHSGKVDCAWILQKDLEENLLRFAQDPHRRNAMAMVLVREDNVALRLSREKLSGALFALCAPQVAIDFVRANVPGLEQVTDEQLRQYYTAAFPEELLFEQDHTEGSAPVHYLTAPVRGLLAVVIVICAVAAAMYWQEDLQRGTFGWLSSGKRSLAELGCQLVALTNVAVVVMLALLLSGTAGALGREAVAMALFVLCMAAFGAALRRLCGSVGVLGMLLPLLVVTMLVVCPVFFDLGVLRGVQGWLPVTWYLRAVTDTAALWGLAAQAAAYLGLYALLGLMKRE